MVKSSSIFQGHQVRPKEEEAKGLEGKGKMEGEINNFIMVWTTVLACLCYCHTIGKLFPKPNFTRFFAILPIAFLFFVLPLNLTSLTLGGNTSFFIGWLATFKILLFAFGNGPLCTSPPLPLSNFIPLACLPIKFQECETSHNGITKKSLNGSVIEKVDLNANLVRSDESYTRFETINLNKSNKMVNLNSNPVEPVSREMYQKKIKRTHKSHMNYLIKIILLAILFHGYTYKNLHPKLRWFFYCLHIYVGLDLGLAAISATVRLVAGFKVEPTFNDPHLATSLQDFWRRWNLMVSNILRAAVYDPVWSSAAGILPEKWAQIPATAAAFLVSGIMHEVVFDNIGRVKPSGEVLCFFLIHGACLAVEIIAKKAINGKFLLPGIVSGPLALAFVILTSFWLFFPPFLRNMADVKGCSEVLAFLEFIKHHKLISPNNITCPYL